MITLYTVLTVMLTFLQFVAVAPSSATAVVTSGVAWPIPTEAPMCVLVRGT